MELVAGLALDSQCVQLAPHGYEGSRGPNRRLVLTRISISEYELPTLFGDDLLGGETLESCVEEFNRESVVVASEERQADRWIEQTIEQSVG